MIKGAHRILNIHRNVPGVLRDINKTVSDAWGIPALHIEVKDGDNELNMAKDAANSIEELFHAAGWDIISKTDRFYPPELGWSHLALADRSP